MCGYLTDSERLDDFKRNPQQFIELAAESINRTKRLALVDGIKYQRIGDEEYYAQELFEKEELTGYLKNMLDVDQVGLRASGLRLVWCRTHVCRATGKERGCQGLCQAARLVQGSDAAGHLQPGLGGPGREGWSGAALFRGRDQEQPVHGRPARREWAKIECGKAHFKALAVGENPAEFVTARNIDDLMARC